VRAHTQTEEVEKR